MASHVVQHAQREARIFKVKTKTYNIINITIQIKIRAKVAGWGATNVRSLAEAKALAHYESKGLGAAACMARLTNPRCDTMEMGPLHDQILAFSPLRFSDSKKSAENWPTTPGSSTPRPWRTSEKGSSIYLTPRPPCPCTPLPRPQEILGW